MILQATQIIQNLSESNKKSEAAKERDYKYHERDFLVFYQKLAG
jgi:hypothetical protein